MDAIEEKRIFDREGATEVVYVAGDAGCVRARVGSAGAVGEFDLEYRGACRDVAVLDGQGKGAPQPVIATPEDVRLGDADGTVGLDFGAAVAVATHRGGVIAAAPDGTVGRWDPTAGSLDGDTVDGAGAVGEWGRGWSLDDPVRALAGDLAATAEGVVRLAADGPQAVGLVDVRDVALADTPLAATAEGVYRLGNGWMAELAGDVDVVAGAPDGRALAVTKGGVYARDPETREWERVDLPTQRRVTDAAIGVLAYAVTEDGTLLAEGVEGWRPNPVGLQSAAALAVATAGR